MKDKHQKHPPLKRPKLGNYHKVEGAVYGTSCGEIESFYTDFADFVRNKFRLTYVDADHSEGPKSSILQIGKKQYGQNQFSKANAFDDKFNVPLSQAAIINGNHYPGSNQIVFINPKKKDSLYRRVDQLTAIDVVLVEVES